MLKHLWTSQSLVWPQFWNSVCKLVMQPQFHNGVVATRSSATRNLEQQKIGGSAEKKRRGAGLFPSLSTGRGMDGNYRKAAAHSLFARVLLCVPCSIMGWLQKRFLQSKDMGALRLLDSENTFGQWKQRAGNHFDCEWPCNDQILPSSVPFGP